ncbi:MAG: carbamoyltransferase C-terminal domain-containing protein [Xanthobacteraceae bacterium]
MYILGIHNGHHDASACLFRDYELVAAVSLERLTRKKSDGVTPELEIPAAAIDECLAVAGIRRGDIDMVCASRAHWELQSYRLSGRWWIKQQYFGLVGTRSIPLMSDLMRKQHTLDAAAIFDADAFKHRHGFPKANLYFYNHHAAHGLPAYFFSEFTDALIYTADGIGDNVSYSVTSAHAGALDVLAGDDKALHQPFRINSVGLLYCYFTDALGFIWNRHEGKVTGLAGFGKPVAADEIMRHFSVDAGGEIASDFPDYPAMHQFARDVCARLSREDAAASVQEATERLVCDAVAKCLRRAGHDAAALSGGIFANVRLNRAILETTPARRVFVFPAMGDEGLPVGGCLLYLHTRDGAQTWHRQRYPLRRLYFGRDYAAQFDAAAKTFTRIMADTERPVEKAVDLLARGAVVAIYTDRMEFGPRALGARSILASPVEREVNDAINKRLERSEFMPFAPVVLEDEAASVFDINAGNAHAARFMTITCAVHPDWQNKIPAVVHVDGSARPQTIRREDNPLYYDVLAQFYARTGLPVLVNTSFNVHEEPIVDTPAQALKSLADGRIDHILTQHALYSPKR